MAYYLKEGQVQRQQLIVGFPHVAKVWQLDSLDGQEVSDLRPPVYWTNQQLRPALPSDGSTPEKASQSRFAFLAPPHEGLLAPQAWWEDSISLVSKYAWLNKQHLGGGVCLGAGLRRRLPANLEPVARQLRRPG